MSKPPSIVADLTLYSNQQEYNTLIFMIFKFYTDLLLYITRLSDE